MRDWIKVLKDRGSLVPFLWVLAFAIVPVIFSAVNAMFIREGVWRPEISTIELIFLGYASGIVFVFMFACILYLIRMAGADFLRYASTEIKLAKIEVDGIRHGRGELDLRKKQGGVSLYDCNDPSGKITLVEDENEA